jgi:hypothetical protein
MCVYRVCINVSIPTTTTTTTPQHNRYYDAHVEHPASGPEGRGPKRLKRPSSSSATAASASAADSTALDGMVYASSSVRCVDEWGGGIWMMRI